jgi:hypothetical protein
MSESEQPARQPPDAYGQPISDDRQRLLQKRLDAWATEASHDLIGPYDSVALTGADVFWLAERSGRGADGEAPNLLLQGARLQSAQLEGADLRGAHLERANLYSANLQGARLNGAHFEGASLEAANLDGAELADAHLDGANLNAARLQGTILGGVSLQPPAPPVKRNYWAGCLWVSSITGLVVVALSMSIVMLANNSSRCQGGGADVCIVLLPPILLFLVLGLLAGVIAALLALIQAGRRGDWVSFTLALAIELLGLGLGWYLVTVIPLDGQLSNYPLYAMYAGAVTVLALLSIPLAPFLQQVLRDQRWAR